MSLTGFESAIVETVVVNQIFGNGMIGDYYESFGIKPITGKQSLMICQVHREGCGGDK
ncbi:hypothetical protein BWQ96_04357 [Gracilariopsis chorda]|uniref:Uncharacterized protein n=1 Tax=Gracilariopsis chorda TaxID=448386 RepID=A0A2V3IUX5_9FLOR|nr:hypothetical protein BWQ96_04357 [Gracilariopsis chorda]|eukprot:PXF45922.1 hypothetical protein BWQ96_04357 [Gracilariopsis chorda]